MTSGATGDVRVPFARGRRYVAPDNPGSGDRRRSQRHPSRSLAISLSTAIVDGICLLSTNHLT